jgi:Raf kinase inhibitor-like YbhB/YbcL family protein
MKIEIHSPAFADGQTMPVDLTADGRNVSPQLKWGKLPADIQSLALICEDPDAPRGTFTHWVLYNLPADLRELSEGMPAEFVHPKGGIQGNNDFGKLGYGGPAPPPGKPHRYFFKLYALDAQLDLKLGATKHQLLEAIRGHIVAEGQTVGLYGR